jgi:hypothetical protein
VKNIAKDMFLFEMSQDAKPVPVTKSMIDSGDFSSSSELAFGNCLLVIKDEKPWVKKREGYSYGHFRKDCLLLSNGKSINCPIMPYNNEQSVPSCAYARVTSEEKKISNVILLRDSISTRKTFFMNIKCQNNVIIDNVKIVTPNINSLSIDRIFSIENSANVKFQNIEINGTYSLENKYGYGILMDNVYKSEFNNVSATAKWGLFGCNNINIVHLKNCNLNRFDIHCYGRDVTCDKCEFSNSDCSYTCVFGKIVYKKCDFNNCTPVHIDASYNVYTPFDVTLQDCTFTPSKKRNYIVMGANLLSDFSKGRRQELKDNFIPTVTINNLTINSCDVDNIYVFLLGRKWYERLIPIKIPSCVKISKIRKNSNVQLYFSNLDMDREIGCVISVFSIIGFLGVGLYKARIRSSRFLQS